VAQPDCRGNQTMTAQIFRYILRRDSGMAPCISDGLVSLATCKPQIRQRAEVGHWVAGFLPRPYDRGLLAYAGRIAEVLPVGEYEKRYRGRPDAVYRERNDGTFERLNPNYHATPEEQEKDLSGPVLVFDPNACWYFGENARHLPEHLIDLGAAGRPIFVKCRTPDRIEALEAWLRGHWEPGVHGTPRDAEPASRRGALPDKSHLRPRSTYIERRRRSC
jgi:hypothetical protein